ncbi:hypothetical protein ASD81_12715 [Nocardioides sp. Root614]|nr:hypothetical protein ASD81_12715 [Nocardioides sp. Root614]KRA89080.1 hypothetical protein ASD84_12980 [Nocardioides sp. Root682]
MVALGALTGCSEDPGSEVGDLVQADAAAVTGLEADVRLPVGVLHLKATAALTSVPATDALDLDDDLVATDDLRYLGVAWELGDEATVPPPAGPLLAGSNPVATLSLVDGDQRYDLGKIRQADAVFIAVPAALPADGHLEVLYDGVVQQVALDDLTVDPGAASALYDDAPAETPEQDCAVRRPEPGVSLDHVCGALLVAMPYVPDAGWAPAGTIWAAVRLETRLLGATVGRHADAATYVATGGEVTATLAGQAPTAAIAAPASDPGDTGAWLVWPMPEGAADLVISGRYPAERTAGSTTQPATREFTTSRVIKLPR